MRGAATKALSDIVEERQQSRYAPFAAAPLRAAAAGLQQNGKVFLREPLASSCLCGEFCAVFTAKTRRRKEARTPNANGVVNQNGLR